MPAEQNGCDTNWFVFVVRLAGKYTFEQRNKALQQMKEQGIQVSNYFPPIHLQPFIAEQFGCRKGDFPVAESVCNSTIALPFYNDLAKEDVAVVCRVLRETLDSLE